MFTELEPGKIDERVTVRTGLVPRPAPDLYRAATRENARRFSWAAEVSEAIGLMETRGGDTELWRMRNPFIVFGTISVSWNLLPESTVFDDLFGPGHGYLSGRTLATEWIASPGADVRQMIVRDFDPLGDTLYLEDGYAV